MGTITIVDLITLYFNNAQVGPQFQYISSEISVTLVGAAATARRNGGRRNGAQIYLLSSVFDARGETGDSQTELPAYGQGRSTKRRAETPAAETPSTT
eukprot:6199231-Pleurochrysis_carterae.AAC.1